MMGCSRLERNDRRCPTRELNFSPETWGKHKSPWRKLRHFVNFFRSSALQRLLYPDLAGVSLVALCLIYYNEIFVGGNVEAMLTMSAAGFGGATTAIGLLAGFRLNASYGRYEECRIFWVSNCTGMMWLIVCHTSTRFVQMTNAVQTFSFYTSGRYQQHNPRSGNANNDVDAG
jgi:hypothetical protein